MPGVRRVVLHQEQEQREEAGGKERGTHEKDLIIMPRTIKGPQGDC